MFGKKRMVEDTYLMGIFEQKIRESLIVFADNPLDVKVTAHYQKFGTVEAKEWNFDKVQSTIYGVDIKIYCVGEIDPEPVKHFIEGELFKTFTTKLWIGYNCTRSVTPDINGETTYSYSGCYEGTYNENSSHQWTSEKMG